MNLNKSVIIGFAIVIGFGLYMRLHHETDRALMERSVNEIRTKLPRTVDSMTTQTGVELGDHLLRSTYRVSETFQTDPETIAAIHKGVLKQACEGADTRKVLAMGYALDNIYDVPTPHGPDQFTVLIKPGDCV